MRTAGDELRLEIDEPRRGSVQLCVRAPHRREGRLQSLFPALGGVVGLCAVGFLVWMSLQDPTIQGAALFFIGGLLLVMASPAFYFLFHGLFDAFGTVVVTLEPETYRVQRRLGPLTWTFRLSPEAIEAAAIGGPAGRPMDVCVLLDAGDRELAFGNGLSDAERLQATHCINRHLALTRERTELRLPGALPPSRRLEIDERTGGQTRILVRGGQFRSVIGTWRFPLILAAIATFFIAPGIAAGEIDREMAREKLEQMHVASIVIVVVLLLVLILISIFLAGLGLFFLLGRTLIELDPRTLRVRRSFLGLGRTRRLALEEPVRVKLEDIETWLLGRRIGVVKGRIPVVEAAAGRLGFCSGLDPVEQRWLVTAIEARIRPVVAGSRD